MALKGNLRDFSITQLFNLIHLARKTGLLTIQGASETAQIYFREGKLSYAQIGQTPNDLATVLYRSRKLSANQVRVLHERAKGMTDKELGLLLINAGYLTQKEILDSLQAHTLEIVRRLFTWVEGQFNFEPNVPPPDGKIPLRIDLQNLIIEGTRQLREWEQLQEEIPSLDMALKFTDRPGRNLRNLNLSVEEWRVISYVNPKNTLRQIAQATRMNELEIRRVVYALLQASIVELVRPAGAIPAARMLPAAQKDQQRSLINRLIERIRSI